MDYKEEMRKFVIQISAYARQTNPNFIIIPQNGNEVLTKDGEPDGKVAEDFVNAIDAWGKEDLFFGYEKDNVATKPEDTNYNAKYLDLAKKFGKKILTTDYCSDQAKMDASYSKNAQKGYISFAADQRNLNDIPTYPARPYNENSNSIVKIADAKNFLYLINAEKYPTKADFVKAVQKTNYDLIIMDAFHNDKLFSREEVALLKKKANGGKRLVVSYISIGEAENYRFYWKKDWKVGEPSFVKKMNPNWKGNFKVAYWDSNWKKIIFGNDNSYTKKLLDAGFDGAYLDIIDAFEYFENNKS